MGDNLVMNAGSYVVAYSWWCRCARTWYKCMEIILVYKMTMNPCDFDSVRRDSRQ